MLLSSLIILDKIMSQYFTLFNLPVAFDIDESVLDQTYHTLATQFHPDKFAAASVFEQKQAVMMASTVNEAYRVLKNPIDRSAYLLKELGIDADAPEHTAFAPEFLMQQMEWRETLAEARAEHDEPALIKLKEEIIEQQKQLYMQLQQDFANHAYEEAAVQVRQGRFLDKMLQEIQAAMP